MYVCIVLLCVELPCVVLCLCCVVLFCVVLFCVVLFDLCCVCVVLCCLMFSCVALYCQGHILLPAIRKHLVMSVDFIPNMSCSGLVEAYPAKRCMCVCVCVCVRVWREFGKADKCRLHNSLVSQTFPRNQKRKPWKEFPIAQQNRTIVLCPNAHT